MSRATPTVRIVEYGNVKLTKPTVIVGFPDVGLIGSIACSYLIEQLKLPEIGYIDSDLLPQVMVVHNSRPSYPIHLFGREDLVVVLSEVPVSPRLSLEIAKELSAWAKARRAGVVVAVSGLPSRKREESAAEDEPRILALATEEDFAKRLDDLKVLPFEEGLITGFVASLLKRCLVDEQSSISLLGESLIQFPDPAAAAGVVQALSGLFSLKIDVKRLLKESEEIRLRTRELMQQTQQQQQQEQELQERQQSTGKLPGAYS